MATATFTETLTKNDKNVIFQITNIYYNSPCNKYVAAVVVAAVAAVAAVVDAVVVAVVVLAAFAPACTDCCATLCVACAILLELVGLMLCSLVGSISVLTLKLFNFLIPNSAKLFFC
jgi:hypothetical protein